MKFAVAGLAFFIATAAHAQSVTSGVTGAVAGATAGASASAGMRGSSGSGGTNDFSVLNTSPGGSSAGGDWSGGARTRIGGQDITIRGAVASEGGSSAFKAGAGVGF